MNGCYQGLMSGILLANRKQEEELDKPTAQTWALLVVKKQDLVERKVQEMFPTLKKRKSRYKKMSSDAFDYGKAEGKKVNLNQIAK